MKKKAVFAGLGDYYSRNQTGYTNLKFTLKNIVDISAQLGKNNWEVSVPLFNETASREQITDKLLETIETLEEDDWLLFYYTGHAARFWINQETTPELATYCVSYSPQLRFDFLPGLDTFFSEFDYNAIINRFHEKAPGGHLITILDCCFAFGLVEKFAEQANFHTIIAASSEHKKAAYNQNSAFFIAFRQCWDMSFTDMPNRVRSLMRNMLSPNIAQIQIAQLFIDKSLNT
jgi:hypothetical protein